MKRYWIWHVVKVAVCIAGGFILFGWLIMTLWNELIPTLFNGPALTFGQALGLFILARLLFWGLRPRSWNSGERRTYWRKHFEKHMESMTPEQREKFRQAYAKRCRKWHAEQTEPEQAVSH